MAAYYPASEGLRLAAGLLACEIERGEYALLTEQQRLNLRALSVFLTSCADQWREDEDAQEPAPVRRSWWGR